MRSRAVLWQEESTTTFSLFQRLDYSTTDARQIIQCKGMKESGEEAIAFVPDTPVFVMLLLLCCLYILFAYLSSPLFSEKQLTADREVK